MDEHVVTLTEVRKRSAELDGQAISVNGKNALLLYPHTVNATLEFDGFEMPTIASMNPESAAHMIANVQAKSFELVNVIHGFIGDIVGLKETAPIKLFLIKNLECKRNHCGLPPGPDSFENVLISRSETCEVFIKDGDGKYYYADFRIKAGDGLTPIVFKPLKENVCKTLIAFLLEKYGNSAIRMRLGGNLLAPWQIEPAVQAKKIADVLGITLKLSPKALAKIAWAEQMGEFEQGQTPGRFTNFMKTRGLKKYEETVKAHRASSIENTGASSSVGLGHSPTTTEEALAVK